jgi:hypothetical protein
MQFDAEAHGIPAAGRSLTQVEVAAGTSTVTVLDGSVLDGDIGKQISIPGAADMSATLAGFPQSRRIEQDTTTSPSPCRPAWAASARTSTTVGGSSSKVLGPGVAH